jgi:acyl-CoA synthetase (AMP-forming)/AMP-acid ligase II
MIADASLDGWNPPGPTVPACIAWWAGTTPDAPALLGFAGEALSYGELQERVLGFAQRLTALGVAPDDRVAAAIPDGIAHALALLAAQRAAIAVPINPAQTRAEVKPILAACAPRALIVAAGTGSGVREAARAATVPVLEVDNSGTLHPTPALGSPCPLRDEPQAEELALILPTSGTTERPRLVPVVHGPWLETCAMRVRTRRLLPRDRCLNAAPGYFVMGVARTAEALISGGSAIVATAAEIVLRPAAVRDQRPTWTWMGPALLDSVLEAASGDAAVAEWPFRFVRSGGARVTPELIARAEALWNVPVLNGYGTTETHGYIAAEADPAVAPRKVGSVGTVRPGLPVAIRADNGAALPAGQTGEITARTGGIFAGYLDDPEASAAAFFPGGWYRTGDLGYLDSEGYLFVTGRAREMINRGGAKIAPHEIDDALRDHPAVAAAAAFALPDRRLGEEVALAVVLREGQHLSLREIRRWLADRLSPHKIPRRVWFVAELPRTGSGKVQRAALTARFQGRDDR